MGLKVQKRWHEVQDGVCVLGYERQQRIEAVTEPLRAIGGASSEWGKELHAVFSGADVHHAFDEFQVVEALKAMDDTHPRIIAGIGKELMDNKFAMTFEGLREDAGVA